MTNKASAQVFDEKRKLRNMAIILIAWLMLAFYRVKYIKGYKAPFSMENALALRGICSIEILIGHLGLPNATGSLYLYPNRKAGILFVGIFLALSGYGLMYSTIHKEGYINKFLFRRILKVLIPAYSIYAIGIIIKFCLNDFSLNIYDFFNWRMFFESTNWYVWEIILLYILYHIFMKSRKQIGIYGIAVSVITLTIIAYIVCWDNPWYGSMLCFVVGILFCMKESELSSIIEGGGWRKIIVVSSIMLFIAISLFVVLDENSMVGNLIARNVASVAFCVLIITLLYKFSIGNCVCFFLARYSYEIFLFHPIFISSFRKLVTNDLFYSLSVILCTIISSVIYKKGYNMIVKK